jgi:hypothetical protein
LDCWRQVKEKELTMEQLGTGLLDDDIVLQDGATSLTHQK